MIATILLPFWMPQQQFETRSSIHWVQKPVALNMLKSTYGFEDLSPVLLAKKSWAAKVTANVTWLPAFDHFAARRAVQFQGYDAKGTLVYSIVAAKAMKGDGDYSIAMMIDSQGYFTLPSHAKDPNIYRRFWCYRYPVPFDNRPGRWAVLMEVREKTAWHSDEFVEAVFKAFGEKAPSLPSQDPPPTPSQ